MRNQARFVSVLLASAVACGSLAARAQQQPVQPVPIYVNTNPEQPPSAPPVPNSARAPNGEYVAPMQQQTQSSYVPQSVAMSGPAQINNWEPGQPIPQGYHAETRTRTGLIVAGAITFGCLYFFSAIAAGIGADNTSKTSYVNGQYVTTKGENPNAALWVPVVGPFIQMGNTSSATANVFLVVDGLGQAAGATMLIVGLVSPKNVLVRNDLGAGVRVTPVGLGGGKLGWGISGTF
jgi:hypothetical protein